MRTWSAVGRVVRPLGVVSRCPLSAPASTRISRAPGASRQRLVQAFPLAVDLPRAALPEERVLVGPGERPAVLTPRHAHDEDDPRRALPDTQQVEGLVTDGLVVLDRGVVGGAAAALGVPGLGDVPGQQGEAGLEPARLLALSVALPDPDGARD